MADQTLQDLIPFDRLFEFCQIVAERTDLDRNKLAEDIVHLIVDAKLRQWDERQKGLTTVS
jgi:hypothetical protein